LIAMAVCTVLVVHGVDWKAGDKIAGPVLTATFLLLFVPLSLRKWRLTPAGAAAVGSLRGAGLGLPGVAPGLRPDSGQTAWALDGPGAAPLPKDRAWSSLGGQWRTVQLGQVLSRPYWSTRSGLAQVLMWTFFCSFWSLMIGGLFFGFNPGGKLI